MSKDSDQQNPPEEHLHMLHSSDGREIVSGLNIMAAVTMDPLCKEALARVLYDLAMQGHNPVQCLNCIDKANEYILEINQMVKNAGLQETGTIPSSMKRKSV